MGNEVVKSKKRKSESEERIIGRSTIAGADLGDCLNPTKGASFGASIGAIVGGIATLFRTINSSQSKGDK